MGNHLVKGQRLLEAYRSTTYVANTDAAGGTVSIRIGKALPELDALLVDNGVYSWAYLTACNPRSERQSPWQNELRHAALRAELEALALPHFEGQGVPAEPGWEPEQSFLILGITLGQAHMLATRFEQFRFVWGQLNEMAVLKTCKLPTATRRSQERDSDGL